MGRLAKILSFVRAVRHGAKISDVKADPGGGPNITAEHFADAGDDAYPLDGDYITAVPVSGEGRLSAVGYVDPVNTPKSLKGDKRIYARDAQTGLYVVEVWLKSDGTALISNSNGSVMLRPDGGTVTTTPEAVFDASADGSIKGSNSNGDFELQAGGDFIVNGAKIDINGRFTDGDGLVFRTHVHSQDSDGNGDAEVDTNEPKNP